MKDITHFLSKVALLMALEQTPPFHSNLSTLHLKPCVGAAIVWVERAKTHSIHVALILASVLGTYCAWQLWRQLQKGCGSASAHTRQLQKMVNLFLARGFLPLPCKRQGIAEHVTLSILTSTNHDRA